MAQHVDNEIEETWVEARNELEDMIAHLPEPNKNLIRDIVSMAPVIGEEEPDIAAVITLMIPIMVCRMESRAMEIIMSIKTEGEESFDCENRNAVTNWLTEVTERYTMLLPQSTSFLMVVSSCIQAKKEIKVYELLRSLFDGEPVK